MWVMLRTGTHEVCLMLWSEECHDGHHWTDMLWVLFFPVGYIYPVLAYTFCKKPSNTREQHKKAYVAFLDARKAFDTVWHECLFVKLHNKRLPMHIWHLLYTWYKKFYCFVTWNNATSASFPFVKVSPLLHSIFVDKLFDLLSTSEFGVRVNSIYIRAPMHVCWQPCFNCRISSRSPIKHAKHCALLYRETRYNLKRSKSLESLPVQELKQDPYGNGISGVRKCKRQMRCTILGFSDLTPSPCRAPQSTIQGLPIRC